MQLLEHETAWLPEGHPESVLCVIPNGRKQPRDLNDFLFLKQAMLKRLIAEAEPEEIEAANNRLRDNLLPDVRIALPSQLLNDPRMPYALLTTDVDESPLAELKSQAREALSEGQEQNPEARILAEELELATFLDCLGV